MVSGSTYLLIGIKNRSIQIFLSSAYLTSFSITVLIVYVMSPPISNVVQGAFFVAASLTGALFGAGSLVFPEVTEGLGCILGGVCLSMWLLALKPGGTLTGTVGKIVFMLGFGFAVWCLSFFRRTRPYGLIGATSFSGATAVVLGVDCFSRAGLKEFWLYIWNLNGNLFPPNTQTYPITQGMQVEIAAIILLCIVGVISQLKLWRVIKDRQEKKEAEQRNAEQRNSAMAETMGRYLEARTDREKAKWEKIYGPQRDNVYGDHVWGSRSTILDSSTDLIEDKRKSRVSVRGPAVGVEMNQLGPPRADHSSLLRSKRQSAVTVHTIPEDDETQADASASMTDVQSSNSTNDGRDHQSTIPRYSVDAVPSVPPLPFAVPMTESTNAALVQTSVLEQTQTDLKAQLTNKRKSYVSILERPFGGNGMASPTSNLETALAIPEPHHSRASSLAATINDELGVLDFAGVHPEAGQVFVDHNRESNLDATPATTPGSSNRQSFLGDAPPSPAVLISEFDPEELARPTKENSGASLKLPSMSNTPNSSRRTSGSSRDLDTGNSQIATSSHAKGHAPSPPNVASTDSLTEGALVRVPSQLSKVMMTYRTKEWANHISLAEASTEDGSKSVLQEAEVEPPVQMAEAPAPLRVEELVQTGTNDWTANREPTSFRSALVQTRSEKRHSTVRRPPNNHAAPARVTLEDRKEGPRLHRSLSDQTVATAPTIIVRPPSSAGGHYTSLPPRVVRSSISPVSRVLSSIIDENAETRFPFPSTAPPLSPALPSPTEMAPGVPQLIRSTSNQSLPLQRPLSHQMYQQAVASTSDTRLSSARDSRQPQRRASAFVPGKRDTMLADWQGSLSRHKSMAAVPRGTLVRRRSEMLLERRQSQQNRQRQELTQQYRDQVVEQAMRTMDMQAKHREAMMKMQAKANRHV